MGYNIYHKDRTGHCGGVCIFIRVGLYSCDIEDEELKKIISGNSPEQLWRCVSNGNDQFLIGCLYRAPPGADKNKNTLIEKEIIKSTYYAKKAIDSHKFNGLFLAGDFNFPYVEWTRDGTSTVKGPENSPGAKFLNLLNDEFMSQNVYEPTFKQANGESKNVLDYVITDTPERIANLQIGP